MRRQRSLRAASAAAVRLQDLLAFLHRHAENFTASEIAPLPDQQVRIAVVNQGAPIAAEQLPRLFDRFFRGDSARGKADAHDGLGLAIVLVSMTERSRGVGRPSGAAGT